MRDERYTHVAIALHWLIAALVLINLYIGIAHEGMDRATMREAMWWHKSIGISVLLLTLARLAWRLTHRVPPLPADTPRWQAIAARASHWAFYILLIGIPLAGWAMSSASPRNSPIPFFGLFDWPFIPWVHGLPTEEAKSLAGTFADVHRRLAYVAIALIVLHVGAALHHMFVRRDNVGRHMLPFLRRRADPPPPTETR